MDSESCDHEIDWGDVRADCTGGMICVDVPCRKCGVFFDIGRGSVDKDNNTVEWRRTGEIPEPGSEPE